VDSGQLASLEQGMRSLLSELGLGWVRANIEEGIVAGVQKEVLVRSDAQRNELALFDEENFRYEEIPSNAKGQRMIGNLRLGPVQRVSLIVEALQRLITELPEIQETTYKLLAPTNDADVAVEALTFLPDEDDGTEAPPSIDAVTAEQTRTARQSAEAFLRELILEAAQS
jgi:hypothetical protein